MTEAQRHRIAAILTAQLREAVARALAAGTTEGQLQAALAARRRRLDAMT